MFSSIRAILFSSFALIILFIVALGFATYKFTQSTGALTSKAINRDFNASVAISQLAIAAQEIRRHEKQYMVYAGDLDKRNQYQNEWNATFRDLKNQLDGLLFNRQGSWDKTDLEKFRIWKDALDIYGAGFEKVVNDVNRGLLTDPISANNAMQEPGERFEVLLNGAAESTKMKFQDAKSAGREINRTNTLLTTILLGVIAVCVIFSTLLLVFVPSAITNPITALSAIAIKMSKGDLDHSISTDFSIKDFKGLAEALERLRISQKTFLQRFSEN